MEAKEPGPATPTCTPPSTASPAWPTPRPSMDEKASTTIGFFCRARASMASPGSCGSSPTTGRTTAPRASSRTSRPWPHAIRGSAPTPHGTMARSSATTASWPRSASTRVPTPQSSSAVTPSRCGTTTTTTTDPTPPAATSLLPPASQHTSPTS